MTAPRLLTESDVARMLRCSSLKVRKLRREGALAFIAGRPVLIAEADLLAYLDAIKVRARARKSWIKKRLAAA
ncbi:helix-turn-helix domain-containing protein [Methylocystis parvus]|uniref:helix-turn-helix domain-containing protein n=1 Tax=Methylocystis parvus TaxID=134 RepID=UPI003C716CC6